MKVKNYVTSIFSKLNTFTFDQLTVLFHIIFQLNCRNFFFMSEQAHTIFIDRYYELSNMRFLEPFRTYMLYSIIKFVTPSKLPHVLKTVEMIENETPCDQIIDTLYSHQKVS